MRNTAAAGKYWQVARYCDLSSQFDDAYRVYAEGHQQHTIAREVELYLVCHALELALKGWLILREPGATPKKLKTQYGHDLGRLAEAVAAHYQGITPHLALIGQINQSYQFKDYEYPDIDDKGINVPMPLGPFAEVASDCRFDLYLTCEQERPTPPGGGPTGDASPEAR